MSCTAWRAMSAQSLHCMPWTHSTDVPSVQTKSNCCVQALEGLPGADGLEAYEFVSRRTGGWDDERRRLQKEGDKRSRLASRVRLCMHENTFQTSDEDGLV